VANLSKALTSKKFYALLIGLLFLFFGERAGVTAAQLSEAVTLIVAYIIGQGLADIRKA
jgi:hypothetical protein